MKIVRLILLLLHIGVFLLLTGMLLNAYIAPKVFPWFNLLSLAFPGLIFGYVILTIFWIICWKKRAFLFFFLGLLFFNPVLRWVNYSSVKSEVPDLKVMSFNTRTGGNERSEVKEYLKDSGADIILLQEDEGKGYGTLGYETATFGNITILSKYKIIDRQFIKINNKLIDDPALRVDVEIKGKRYRFISVHLQSFGFVKKMVRLNGDNEEDEKKVKNIVKKLIPTFKMHQEQVDIIKEEVENSPYPVILTGDFNSVPNSYEYYHISEVLQDVFVAAGRGSGTSFHDYKFPIRIDYIFTSKSIKALSYKVDRSTGVSDHFPVIATFSLKN
ncbi:endonuclease/exonuclease/phosphatase family protein [uncultured Chryseobacterium sp.]|uniref:endonuclease/exonuclease/phosphatase family protein n=1 Tax=uncultured Chryseobacterium sp. TaxID=259322 RepID=UPI0025E2C1ED|nr:endonuclease/exonuclease/phosphatase family protein [uncultured Chryseobacterium sp.]